ncbi:MAG: glycerophosphodiester phosphodiesterase [Streptosporangiales bacterium]|nr:glycerophosphodiester phosphodiesterase [Streptosporangiales bacterium]MBO0890467.1 glycerophosphodiester phosphodiesterase [Acidothermales bacterium]
MDRVFTDPPAPIGHRGFGKNAEGRPVENTVESVATAVEADVDWVEIDVRRTSADQLVVLHDPAWSDGTVVVEHDAAPLRDLGITGLDVILDALPPSVGIDIEVKPGAEHALVPADRTPGALLCPALERELGHRPLLVTSFDPATLTLVRDRVPGIPLGYITWMTFPFDLAVASAAQLGVEVLMAHTVSYEEPKLASRRRPADVAADRACGRPRAPRVGANGRPRRPVRGHGRRRRHRRRRAWRARRAGPRRAKLMWHAS